MKRFPAVLFFLAAISALGQVVSLGLKAGMPMTDLIETGAFSNKFTGFGRYSSITPRYTFGPAIEFRLPLFSLALEVDVLYKRLDYSTDGTGPFGFGATHSDTTGNSLEFPVLVKRRFGHARVRPFFAAGAALRHLSGFHQVSRAFGETLVPPPPLLTTTETSDPTEFRKRFYPGLTAAGGMEFRIGRLRLAPEIRYTYWTSDRFRPLFRPIAFAANQADFLLGLTF